MSNKQLYEKENNINKPFFPVVRLEDIIDTISEKSIQWILNNYNHIYVEWKNNVVGTRLSVPTILRKNGLWITYNNGDRLITEYYIGKNTEIKDKHWQDDANWEDYTNKLIDGTVEYKHLSESLKQLFNKGNVTNFPDEEDLTSDGVVLSFKDREYQPENFSGLGRVILRKNIVKIGEEYKNILTQSMINKENTIYEIRYDFDLNGQEITIPEGCVLDFQGGSLNNGSIIGNNTAIKTDLVKIFDLDINVLGNWNISEICPEWFGAIAIESFDSTKYIQKAIDTEYPVLLNKGVYSIYEPINIKNGGLCGKGSTNSILFLKSNIAGLHLYRDNIKQRDNIIIEKIKIQGELSNINNTIALKFIDNEVGKYNSGTIIKDLDIDTVGIGMYIQYAFRLNVNNIGMSVVINPLKLVGSNVQCNFRNITCNLDYNETCNIEKIGLDARDTSNALESVLFFKCSFVGYDYGVYFIAPSLIVNFEYLDLDFCKIIPFILGNSNAVNITNSWFNIDGNNAEAFIKIITLGFFYDVINISGCTFNSNSEQPPYCIIWEDNLDKLNKLIINNNTFKSYPDKKIKGIIKANKLTNVIIDSNVITVNSLEPVIHLDMCYNSIAITNNIIKGNIEIIIPSPKTTCIVTNNDIENLNITNYSIEDDVLDIKGNTGSLSFHGQPCSNNFIGDVRPYHAPIGSKFFDTTINKPIYRVEGKWVDATGADV